MATPAPAESERVCPIRGVGRILGSFFQRRRKDRLYQEIFAEEIAAWRARGARLIDVREPFEFAAGHIPGTENVPLTGFPNGLEADGRPVVLICASGNRS